MKRLLLILIILILPRLAEADCSGSGVTWTCTAGTTPAQINTTLGSATDGATLTFDAGSYTWSANINLSLTKGVTLICATTPPTSAPWGAATSGGCDVAGAGQIIIPPVGTSTKLYRFSGFNISGNYVFMRFCPGGFPSSCTGVTSLTQLRFDHMTFNRTSGTGPVLHLSEGGVEANFEGVVDHVHFIQVSSYNLIDMFPGTPATPINGRMGTVKNLIIEDTTFESTTGVGDSMGAGCLDFGGGIGIVVRYSTSNNCRMLGHSVTHATGPANFELIRNTLSKLSNSALGTYRMIHHQGSGTFMIFQNAFDANGLAKQDAIVVLHYRAFEPNGAPSCDGNNMVDGNRSPTTTYRGYPCAHQPGRDYDLTFHPMAAFGNTWETGTKLDLVINNGGGPTPDYTTAHLVHNRDIWNAVSANAQSSSSSPFSGATGIGFGTIANRPTTCSVGPDSDVGEPDEGRSGVMYWATDEGEWDSSNGATADGKLYICSATNTWTARYGTNTSGTPFCYPHPLVSGVACGSAPPPPSGDKVSSRLRIRF